MITWQNASKDFNLDGKRVITPVKDVTLQVNPGEFIIITGRSGSGKTTLLNLAAGLVKPTRGKVIIDQVDLSFFTDQQLAALRSRELGFIFQFPSLLPNLTALENVVLSSGFAHGNGKGDVLERANNLFADLGIKDKTGSYPRQLSAGEQKRVVIARALMNHPSVILADEPTSDLDSQTEQEIMAILKGVNEAGVAILMVTHHLQLLSYASRAFRMDNGALLALEKQEGASKHGDN
jgi:ABC-type lipoprotein export system ATPase subunit